MDIITSIRLFNLGDAAVEMINLNRQGKFSANPRWGCFISDVERMLESMQQCMESDVKEKEEKEKMEEQKKE